MRVSSLVEGKGSNIVSVTPASQISDVAHTLREHRIGAVLVLSDDGAIAGMLSERDIVRGVAEHGNHCLTMSAGDLMTRSVVTCGPDDSVDRVMALMTEHRIRHLPVTDAGGLVGIISIGDVVKHKIEQIEAEAKEMRDYIQGS